VTANKVNKSYTQRQLGCPGQFFSHVSGQWTPPRTVRAPFNAYGSHSKCDLMMCMEISKSYIFWVIGYSTPMTQSWRVGIITRALRESQQSSRYCSMACLNIQSSSYYYDFGCLIYSCLYTDFFLVFLVGQRDGKLYQNAFEKEKLVRSGGTSLGKMIFDGKTRRDLSCNRLVLKIRSFIRSTVYLLTRHLD